MKNHPSLFLILLLIPSFSFAQFDWNKLDLPAEVSINNLAVSPDGSVYIQSPRAKNKLFHSQTDLESYVQEDLKLYYDHHFDIDFFDNGTAVVSNEDGIEIRGADGNWQVILQENNRGTAFDVVSTTLYVADDGFIYVSNDYGETFETIAQDIKGSAFEGGLHVRDNKIFLFTEFGATDYLQVFDLAGNPIIDQVEIDDYFSHILITDCGEIILLSGTDEFYSNDLGQSWIKKDLFEVFIDNIFGEILYAENSGGEALFALTNGGVYKRSVCGNEDWSIYKTDDELFSLVGFFPLPSGETIAYGQYNNKFYKSAMGDSDWVTLSPDIDFASVVDVKAHTKNELLLQTKSNSFYISKDAGSTWENFHQFPIGTIEWDFAPNGDAYFWEGVSNSLYKKNVAQQTLEFKHQFDGFFYDYNMYVAGDDVLLFIGWMDSFFTKDGGEGFESFNSPLIAIGRRFTVKKVGEEVYIFDTADPFNYRLGTLNITNSETFATELDYLFYSDGESVCITENGWIYFTGGIENSDFSPELYLTKDKGENVEILNYNNFKHSRVLDGPDDMLFVLWDDKLEFLYDDNSLKEIAIPAGEDDLRFLNFTADRYGILVTEDDRVYLSDTPMGIEVDVKPEPLAHKMQIFPNPTNERIVQFVIPGFYEPGNNYELRLVSNEGRTVKKLGKFDFEELELPAFATGVYHLQIWEGEVLKGVGSIVLQ